LVLDPGSFELVAEPTTTISQIKARLNTEHGVPATCQELIYGGKLLKDTQTLEDVSFVESSFLACVTIASSKMHLARRAVAADSTGPQPVSGLLMCFKCSIERSMIAEFHLLPTCLLFVFIILTFRVPHSCILD
jgi:hypothetical protein